MCLSGAVVNVSTDGLQRNGALVIGLASCDFCAAQTAGNTGLDPLCAQTHSTTDGLLHCTSEGNTVLQIQRNLLSNQLSIHIRLLNFNDVDSNLLLHHSFQLPAELLDFCAASADYNAGLCAVDVDSNLFSESLNFDLRNTCSVQALLDEVTYVVVFYQCIAEICLVRKPARIPILDNANTQTVRIYFLAHS